MTEETKIDEFSEIREQIINFVKTKKNYLIYVALAFIIWLGVFLRTRGLPMLKDITTGQIIPGDPDSHLFLRYAEYILEHGQIMTLDLMRYVPFGKSTASVETIIPYTIVYMYKIIHVFIPSITIQTVDTLYPAIFFVFIAIAFFLLIKQLFNSKIAILATLLLSIIPSFLSRTMVGVSDKEPMGILFMFLAFYFYVLAWQSKKVKLNILFGLLAGISTSLMGLAWGGVTFVFIIIALFVLIEIFMNKFKKKDFYIYVSWIIPWIITFIFVTAKYGTIKSLIYSFSTGLAFLALIVASVNFIVFKLDLIKIKSKIKEKLPTGVTSTIIALIFSLIIVIILFGPSYISGIINDMIYHMLHPMGVNRWLLTVAENQQPYFTDWVSTFGRFYFYLFFIGAVLLFYNLVKELKHKWKLTILFALFIFAFIVSRYSRNSATWNGVSNLSKTAYFGSLIVFVAVIAIIYLHSFYKNKELYTKLTNLDRNYIFVLVWFVFMIVAARGALRLFFVFAPITVILVSYLFVKIYDYIGTLKEKSLKIFCYVVIALILFNPITIWGIPDGMVLDFTKESYNNAKYSGYGYGQQWQIGMKWVRENTPEDSVFAHWWDYGYWIQTGGKRATVLDGGNSFVYWNHLIGRYVLTNNNLKEALEFLKTHKTTHFLIDPSDIGKYTAYSSIGSDINYDRYSWITVFMLDTKQTMETRNEIVYVYTGGTPLDEDFIWNNVVYPGGNAGIAGFLVPVKKDSNETNKIVQPTAALVYNGNQVNIPLECIYFNGEEIHYGSGYPGCLKIIPSVQGDQINPIGASYFLSKRVTNGLMGQLYLLNRKIEGFDLVYSDEDKFPLLIYNGRQIGPLKIWKVSYTSDIKERKDFLEGNLPEWF